MSRKKMEMMTKNRDPIGKEICRCLPPPALCFRRFAAFETWVTGNHGLAPMAICFRDYVAGLRAQRIDRRSSFSDGPFARTDSVVFRRIPLTAKRRKHAVPGMSPWLEKYFTHQPRSGDNNHEHHCDMNLQQPFLPADSASRNRLLRLGADSPPYAP